ATSLVPSVKSILSKRGDVVADSTSNALVITEVTSRIEDVVEFVKGLDLRTPQVSIQAKIIFVDRTDVEELGVKYDLGSATQLFNQLVHQPGPQPDLLDRHRQFRSHSFRAGAAAHRSCRHSGRAHDHDTRQPAGGDPRW